MRVALVDPGQQVPYYDRELAAALASAGLEVALLTAPLYHYDPGPTAPAVAVRWAFGRLLAGSLGWRLARHAAVRRLARAASYAPELWAAGRWLRGGVVDLVHWQWSLLPGAEAMVMRRLQQRGLPVVLTVHNVLPHEPRPWLGPRSLGRFYGSADALVVHSSASRDRLLSLFPNVQPSRVRIIPMAPPSGAERLPRTAARGHLGLPLDRPLVLHFGHVRPYKGLDVLLEAAGTVRQHVPDCLFLIAGALAGGAAGARALQRQLAAVGLDSVVSIRPGYVPDSQVASFFAAADLVVLPYRETDDSAVLLMCRAFGRPVVATAVGGIPEVLANGGGLLVSPGDAPALANALVHLLRDERLRHELASQAQAAARAWTWSEVARHHVAMYESFRRSDG